MVALNDISERDPETDWCAAAPRALPAWNPFPHIRTRGRPPRAHVVPVGPLSRIDELPLCPRLPSRVPFPPKSAAESAQMSGGTTTVPSEMAPLLEVFRSYNSFGRKGDADHMDGRCAG